MKGGITRDFRGKVNEKLFIIAKHTSNAYMLCNSMFKTIREVALTPLGF